MEEGVTPELRGRENKCLYGAQHSREARVVTTRRKRIHKLGPKKSTFKDMSDSIFTCHPQLGFELNECYICMSVLGRHAKFR